MLIDAWKKYTDDSYFRVKKIWHEAAHTRPDIHDNAVFGSLCVHLYESGEDIAIIYENICADISLETCQMAWRSPEPEADVARYFVERIALPILRMCRGCLVMHGCAVAMGELSGVFLAPSGVGKSTCAAKLLNHDVHFMLLGDDAVCIVPWARHGVVLPSSSHIAMRHASFDHAPFVSKISHAGLKKLLWLKPAAICRKAMPLQYLLRLGAIPQKVGCYGVSAPALGDILQSQFVFSNVPDAFKRMQFQNVISLARQSSSLNAAGMSEPVGRCFLEVLSQ